MAFIHAIKSLMIAICVLGRVTALRCVKRCSPACDDAPTHPIQLSSMHGCLDGGTLELCTLSQCHPSDSDDL
jgi:hypothetical protein